MTKEEYDQLKAGDMMWAAIPYFKFAFPCVIRIDKGNGVKYAYVNLFGRGHVVWGDDRDDAEDNVEIVLKTLFKTQGEAIRAMEQKRE